MVFLFISVGRIGHRSIIMSCVTLYTCTCYVFNIFRRLSDIWESATGTAYTEWQFNTARASRGTAYGYGWFPCTIKLFKAHLPCPLSGKKNMPSVLKLTGSFVSCVMSHVIKWMSIDIHLITWDSWSSVSSVSRIIYNMENVCLFKCRRALCCSSNNL